MWDYCKHRSRSVEIVYKSSEEKEILTQAYFPYNPDLEVWYRIHIICNYIIITDSEKVCTTTH